MPYDEDSLILLLLEIFLNSANKASDDFPSSRLTSLYLLEVVSIYPSLVSNLSVKVSSLVDCLVAAFLIYCEARISMSEVLDYKVFLDMT